MMSRHTLQSLFILSLFAGATACEGTIEDQRFRGDAGVQEPGESPTDMSRAVARDMSVWVDMEDADASSLDMSIVGDMASDAGVFMDAGTPPDAGTQPPDMSSPEDMPSPPQGSAGCRGGSGIADGEHTFMQEGLQRRFIMRLPENYDATKMWPVVLALHGNGGNTSYWDSTGGARDVRGVLRNDAILIVAEAIDNQWRDYGQAQSTWPARIEQELGYFDKILTEVRDELCVDEDRIFAMGFSGGGSFSGVLGCRRKEIRAIAVGGSVIYFDPADCVNTPAAWITIGAEEQAQGRTDYLNFFRARAGCAATSSATPPSPCVAYDSCDAGRPVHYCEHAGGHQWPAIGDQAMWDFFSQF